MPVKLPRYSCSIPELSDALNEMAGILERVANRNFSAGVGMLVNADDDNVIYSANVDSGGSGYTYNQLFRLVDVSDETGFNIRVRISTLCDLAPTGFYSGDTPNFVFEGLTVSGVIYGHITIDSSGVVTARAVEQAATMPASADPEFYVEIGSFDITGEVLTVTNSRYGPIPAQVCPNAYTSPLTYSVTFS